MNLLGPQRTRRLLWSDIQGGYRVQVPAFKKQTLSIWMSSAWSQNRKPSRKINTTKVGSLKKISKIDKSLGKTEKERKKSNTQITNIRNKTRDITTDPIGT